MKKEERKRMFCMGTVMAMGVLFALAAGSAGAKSIEVTTTVDAIAADGECSLREAIQAANTDSAVDVCNAGKGADKITLGAGLSYILGIAGAGEDDNQTGDLDIWDDLTIEGNGATIDGNGLDRVLHIQASRPPKAPTRVRVTALTVTGGVLQGILGWDPTDPPKDEGGGVLITDAKVSLDAVTVTGNSAGDGGGVSCIIGCTLDLDDCVLSNNVAADTGGGLRVFPGDPPRAFDTNATVNRCLVVGNRSLVGAGGGISNEASEGLSSTLTVVESTVTGNAAIYGGGIVSAGFNPFVGGAPGTGTLSISRSTISYNSATAISASFLSGVAGGLLNVDGSATVSNSTVSGNDADVAGNAALFQGWGGGIMNMAFVQSSAVDLIHVTVATNQAALGGGIASYNDATGDATMRFANTIVDGNTATVAAFSCLLPPGNVSLGGNVEDYNACGFDAVSDQENVSAMLDVLANNGGLTDTHALMPGSPASGAGLDVACSSPPVRGRDQRGVKRAKKGGCDSGAYENDEDRNDEDEDEDGDGRP